MILGFLEIIFSAPLKGIIRREDVRQTEKDRVELSKCFRPNDIVFAKVLSLGDSQSYLLTTAGDELGVVLATRKGVTIFSCNFLKDLQKFCEPKKVNRESDLSRFLGTK